MATHPTAVRNGIADFVVDQLDGGTTNSTARMVFQTSGDVEVATLNMSNPAFGAAAAGVATAAAVSDDTNATGGTVAQVILTDRDNTTIIEGTVGTSGTDIIVTSTAIAAGDTVRVTSLTYTAPN